MKNNSKSKKSKITLCPQKNKFKKNVREIIPFLDNFRKPSTPSLISTKNINISSSLSMINNNKIIKNQNLSNSSSKQSLFHAFIPRNKTNSKKNLKKQKIILIKRVNI